jgi:hypothetical protein
VAFAGGPLGKKITTPDGQGLFLANINTSGRSRATVQLISAGTVIKTLTTNIPEPATAVLSGLCLALMLGIRRTPKDLRG